MKLEKDNPAPVTIDELRAKLDAAVPDGTHCDLLVQVLGEMMVKTLKFNNDMNDWKYIANAIGSVLPDGEWVPVTCTAIGLVAAEFAVHTALQTRHPQESLYRIRNTYETCLMNTYQERVKEKANRG